MELTEYEKSIIEDHVKIGRDEIKRRRMIIELLETAAEFEKFLYENGIGPTFSTFCEDFGYPAKDKIDRGWVYHNVISIIKGVKVENIDYVPDPEGSDYDYMSCGRPVSAAEADNNGGYCETCAVKYLS